MKTKNKDQKTIELCDIILISVRKVFEMSGIR